MIFANRNICSMFDLNDSHETRDRTKIYKFLEWEKWGVTFCSAHKRTQKTSKDFSPSSTFREPSLFFFPFYFSVSLIFITKSSPARVL